MVDDKDLNKTIQKEDMELELVDYAILKSLIFGNLTIADMVKILQVRVLVIEKHIYELSKLGFVIFQQQFIITPKGIEKISSFERDKSIDVWKPVDDFIINSIENRKKGKIRLYKTIDYALLALMVILIILIIYFVIFY